MNKNMLATYVSFCSLVISITSVIASVAFGLSQNRQSRLDQVTQAISQYITQYQSVRSAHQDDPFQIKGYVTLNDRDRSSVKITAGLLIQVIEDMRRANDKRAGRWSDFIGLFSGPLYCGYPLDIYASKGRTIQLIKKEVRKIDNEAQKGVSANRYVVGILKIT